MNFIFTGEIILAATTNGHDTFSLVVTQTRLQSITSMLDENDDTQLPEFEAMGRSSFKRKHEEENEVSPPKRLKRYTTRSSGTKLPS